MRRVTFVLLRCGLAGDPDIDTAPLLTWSTRLAKHVVSSGGRFGSFFLRHQAVLYFPILFVARVSWLLQSLLFVLGLRTHTWGPQYPIDTVRRPAIELFSLALYYVWNYAILYEHVFWEVCIVYK